MAIVHSVNEEAQVPLIGFRARAHRVQPIDPAGSRYGRAGDDVVLVPLAVEAIGRRTAEASVVDDDALASLAAARASGVPVVVALDHAGWGRARSPTW